MYVSADQILSGSDRQTAMPAFPSQQLEAKNLSIQIDDGLNWVRLSPCEYAESTRHDNGTKTNRSHRQGLAHYAPLTRDGHGRPRSTWNSTSRAGKGLPKNRKNLRRGSARPKFGTTNPFRGRKVWHRAASNSENCRRRGQADGRRQDRERSSSNHLKALPRSDLHGLSCGSDASLHVRTG